MRLFLGAVPLACAADTAQRDDWTTERPTTGHCALASRLTQQNFGGTIARGLMSNGVTHYWNVLPGAIWLDTTRDQFDPQVFPTYVIPDCSERVYWFEDTQKKFNTFKLRFYTEYNKLEDAANSWWR